MFEDVGSVLVSLYEFVAQFCAPDKEAGTDGTFFLPNENTRHAWAC